MAKQTKRRVQEPVQTKETRALYVRVSTEAQAEEGFSVGAQTERLIGYCTAMGWNDYELYIDGGFSGSNLNRTAMQRMIEDVQNKKLKSILVYKLDRLSRSQKDTLYLIEDVFMPNNVDFISLNESIDTSSPYGRAMIGILSAFAQLERENIFMRTRMGMLERVKKGYWMGGGRTPYGYDYDSDAGILIPNADATNVRKIYELYIKGYSCHKLATLFGLTSDAVAMNVLNRRSNLGIISYNGEEYEGKHDAIIDEKTYLLAQHKMRERSQCARVTQKSAHLLSGIIYCGHCGARLRYIRWGKEGYKLRCYSLEPSKVYMQRDEDCPSEAVWANEIEQIVLTDMFKLSAQMNSLERNRYMGYVDPLVELKNQCEVEESVEKVC